MNILKSRELFNFGLGLAARISRRDQRGTFILPLMRLMGRATGSARKLKPKDNIKEIGTEWQRMFPAGKKHMPLVAVSEDTVIAEIRLPCPLKDTGDVHACYRMMEYDREMVRQIGGEFVVLESQSNNGKGICRIAMRKKGSDLSDLVPAHER